MRHFTTPEFWDCYRRLPKPIQRLADKCFDILKTASRHPSLHLKRVKKYQSVRVGLHYRALAVETEDGLLWFWIGSHSEYNMVIR